MGSDTPPHMGLSLETPVEGKMPAGVLGRVPGVRKDLLTLSPSHAAGANQFPWFGPQFPHL